MGLPGFRCPKCQTPLERWLVERVIYSRYFPTLRCPHCDSNVRCRYFSMPLVYALWLGLFAGTIFLAEQPAGYVVAYLLGVPWLADYVLPLWVALTAVKEPSPWAVGAKARWSVRDFAGWRCVLAAILLLGFRNLDIVQSLPKGVLVAAAVTWVYLEVLRKALYVQWDKKQVATRLQTMARRE